MGDTKIEWADKTWNPIRGCSRVSAGCVHCYAERQAARFSAKGEPFHQFVTRVNGHAAWTGKVELVEKHLEDPLHWRKPCKVFVNSMSDLFHEALPDEAIDRVFAVMALCPQHTFQILTKRPERMLNWMCTADCSLRKKEVWDWVQRNPDWVFASHLQGDWWPLKNVWLGVSVEDQATTDERIPLLLKTPAVTRFVSYEPALGPVDFSCQNPMHAGDPSTCQSDYCPCSLDWVIVGGESGPGARPFDIQWARNIVAQCKAAGVACFVKQLGALPIECLPRPNVVARENAGVIDRISMSLKDRKGGDWSEWPEDLRIREFPNVGVEASA